MVRQTVDAEQGPGPALPVLVLAVLGAAMVTAEILPGSMMPLMAVGLNTSEGMVGQAVTASALVAIATSLSLGAIAGQRDRRRILITLTLVLVVSNLGVALAPNIWVMLAARLLLGAAIGINWGLVPSIVLRLAPANQFARTFATVALGVSVAAVISAPLSAWLGDIIGWRVVYLGGAAVSVVALLLLVFAFPPLPANPDAMKRDLRGTLQLPGLVAGMAGVMMLFGGTQAFLGYLVPFMKDVTGLSTAAVSITLLLTGISGVAGTLVASRLLGFSIYGVLVAVPAILTLLTGLLLYTGHAMIPVVGILMLWMGTRAVLGVAVNAWIAHNFPDHVEGAGGILVAVIQGSMMLGAILGGVLIDTSGAGAPPAAGTVILAIGTIYCLQMMKPRPPLTGHDTDDGLVIPPLQSSVAMTDDPA